MAVQTQNMQAESEAREARWLVVILVFGGEVVIVPDRRIVPKPSGGTATVTWILVPAGGLTWDDDGIEMEPPWDAEAWGAPEKVGNTYRLTVGDGPVKNTPYKYTVRLKLNGVSLPAIDPEVEYD